MPAGVAGFMAVLLCSWAASTAAAQGTPEDRTRPIRVGNLNVAVVGVGYVAHDHPTYDDHLLLDVSYQRRILRREVRTFPLWVRLALQFTENDRTIDSTYTYWDNPVAGEIAGVEDVQEQTSDFGIRAELLLDALHGPNYGIYGGGGFVVHLVNFTSRGITTGRGGASGIETDENQLGPSAVAGVRLFSAKHPYTFYGEVRYGFTYGRALGSQDAPVATPPNTNEFDIESTSNVSFEAGVGVHW